MPARPQVALLYTLEAKRAAKVCHWSQKSALERNLLEAVPSRPLGFETAQHRASSLSSYKELGLAANEASCPWH